MKKEMVYAYGNWDYSVSIYKTTVNKKIRYYVRLDGKLIKEFYMEDEAMIFISGLETGLNVGIKKGQR